MIWHHSRPHLEMLLKAWKARDYREKRSELRSHGIGMAPDPDAEDIRRLFVFRQRESALRQRMTRIAAKEADDKEPTHA